MVTRIHNVLYLKFTDYRHQQLQKKNALIATSRPALGGITGHLRLATWTINMTTEVYSVGKLRENLT